MAAGAHTPIRSFPRHLTACHPTPLGLSLQSFSAMSVCTDCDVDSDCDEDDLDFCLVTPQQAVGALVSPTRAMRNTTTVR